MRYHSVVFASPDPDPELNSISLALHFTTALSASFPTKHPTMNTPPAMLNEERNQRIDHALSSLVETFLPGDLSEDDESVGERHDTLLDRARHIINR